MYPIRVCLSLAAGAVLALALTGRGGAQDKEEKPAEDDVKAATRRLLRKAEEEYRIFFKKPAEVVEFWAAMKFEIQLGKFDVASLHLKLLLEKTEKVLAELLEKKMPEEAASAAAYKDLLRIEEVEGMSAFFTLAQVRRWSPNATLQKEALKNVDLLLDRVTKAVNHHLGDPERIRKFIRNLDAPTPEERAFALARLARSGRRASPYLLQEVRDTAGKLRQQRLLDAMVKIDADIVLPMLEALNARDRKDAAEADMRLALLQLIRRRADKRAIPYLWHLSAGARYPEVVRTRAAETLAYLLETAPEQLPPAKVALTQLAEKLYQHKAKFLDPRRILLWDWTKDYKINPKPDELSASEYEEIFGQRYARQALELDKNYRPAQLVLLNLTLERAYEGKLDQLLLGKTNPAIDQLLLTIDPELLLEFLDRALSEHHLVLILPGIKAVAERGLSRAARPPQTRGGGPLLRALYYPDRRVQFAAAGAMLRLPSEPVPVAGGRVIEILSRFLTTTGTPKALVIHTPPAQAAKMRNWVKAAGYDPVLAANVKEGLAQLRQSADFEVILLHHAVPENEARFVLSQLRNDQDAGLLPLLLINPTKGTAPFGPRDVARHRNVTLLPEAVLSDGKDLKDALEEAIKFAAAPDSVVRAEPRQADWLREDLRKSKGQKLTLEERKQFAAVAMETLWQMSRGLIKGYDVRPAAANVVEALQNDDTVGPALDILATFPGAEPQQRLAAVVLDGARGKWRVTAALGLNRHVQKNGLALTLDQIGQMRELYRAPGVDPALRGQLAVFVGGLRSTATTTGGQLYRFNPNPPPPPK